MEKSKIIGLTGYKQSGKSVASKYLQEKYGYKPHNFKDSLIKELKENFPDLLEEIRGDTYGTVRPGFDVNTLFQEKPPLIRKLMQNYATEVRRKENPDYWRNKWIERVSYVAPDNVVVDDVRFLNEAEAVKNLGGILIKIIRTAQEKTDTHSSETEHELIKPNFIIEAGEGKQEELYKQLDEIINKI